MKWVFLAAVPFGLLFLQTRGPLAFVMLAVFAVRSPQASRCRSSSPRPTCEKHRHGSGLIVGSPSAPRLGVAVLAGWRPPWPAAALAISALTPLAASWPRGFCRARDR